MVVGNLAGLLLCYDPLSVPGEYLRHVRDGHKLVNYNRVEFNPQLTSWNNALLAAGGPLIELGAGGMLAGYAVVLVIVAGRCRGRRPDSAWLLAVGAAAGPVCCQVWAYEVVLLVVGLLPLLMASGGRQSPEFATRVEVSVSAVEPNSGDWRPPLAVLGALWLLKSVPVEAGNAVAEVVGGRLGQVVLAYRSFAALGILAVVFTAWPPGGGSGRPRR